MLQNNDKRSGGGGDGSSILTELFNSIRFVGFKSNEQLDFGSLIPNNNNNNSSYYYTLQKKRNLNEKQKKKLLGGNGRTMTMKTSPLTVTPSLPLKKRGKNENR
ncbi:hypothetical protein DERP_006721 [Dermatophagoides pteronyssinus]|uniref:Uncharacterized protein n=1 Tax=Dermatophagoides pteronyssinus TaxID=6956 RepID=A0ABQ8IS69_DERPT|nr:hypothetical protein DERP_006721 [Dermatophagoides pteronyssinus]